MHYVIIGGGPAGLSAAATLRRIDEKCQVTILAKERFLPYSKMALPYLINGQVAETSLFLPTLSGVNIVLTDPAIEVNSRKLEVRTASGKKFSYDKLLIASGAAPVRPDIQGNRLPFVYTIRDLPDVRRLSKRLRARKTGHAVVAGAGPVGLELSDALSKLGLTISLVISSDRVFSTMLDPPASAFLERKLLERGVEVCKNTDIVRIHRSGEVVLSSGQSRMCDAVIFGKGVTPHFEFLSGSGIAVAQGIKVDEHQETNIPGVYAAGDVAETWDMVHDESRVNALWPVAFEQGRIAAHNMASRPLAYEGSFPRNVVRVFGTSIFAGGIGKADGPEVHCETGRDFHHKIVLDRGVLRGFIFVGEVKSEGLYADLLRRKIHVGAFAESLLHGTFCYAQFLRIGSSRANQAI